LHAAIIDNARPFPHASKEILTTLSITVYNRGPSPHGRTGGALHKLPVSD